MISTRLNAAWVQGIATGSLLYVVFFEILEKERQKHVSGILQVSGLSFNFIRGVFRGGGKGKNLRTHSAQKGIEMSKIWG